MGGYAVGNWWVVHPGVPTGDWKVYLILLMALAVSIYAYYLIKRL